MFKQKRSAGVNKIIIPFAINNFKMLNSKQSDLGPMMKVIDTEKIQGKFSKM